METKLWIIIALASAAVIAATTVGVITLLPHGPHHDAETLAYHANLNSIAQTVNSKATTWKAGNNDRWLYMGKSAILAQMGAFKISVQLPVVDTEAASIPDTFDSRVQWPSCDSIKEVRDQSNCGSCWAFGAVEAMSDRICIASNQTRQDRISAQDMVSCCDACGMGCDGGDPGAAWQWYQDTGVVTGFLYADTKWCEAYALAPCDHHTTGQYTPCPAEVPTPPCTKQCTKSYSAQYKDDKHFAKSAYAIGASVKAIQTEIMTNGPIEVAFDVYEDFLSYKSGVYQHTTGSMLGGHAVKMLGWGTENGTPYWLVANSWNEDWGDKGFFKIIRGQDECGIEDQCVAGIPKL